MAITEDIQLFDPGPLVELFQLDISHLDGPVLYFTKVNLPGQNVVFAGNTYTAIDIEAEGFEWNGKGAFPRPKVRINNVNRLISSVLLTYDDLLGSEFTRIRTFRQYLDDGSSPDSSQTFPLDKYKVERKLNQNKIYVEFELSTVLDQQGVKLPRRQFLKDACTHSYRIYDGSTDLFDYSNASCPYEGSDYFDENDDITTAENDNCSRRLSSCRLRFGNDPLPTRAFPGIKLVR